ncbi:MAG: type 2 lanthipeptide synthetase LanM family protein [Nostochopsis sp.]
MVFYTKDIIKISQSASTLAEKLSNQCLPNQIPEKEVIINSRIEQWCQIASEQNWEKFKKRIGWDNLNLSTVRCALVSVSTNDEQKLPSWTQALNECLKAVSKLNTSEEVNSVNSRFLNSQQSLPFEEVLLPFIDVAHNRLSTQTSSNYQLLSDVAHASLERSLLRWLIHICLPSMELEFSVFRASRQSSLISRLHKLTDTRSQPYYQDFIKYLLSGGLLTFFQEYPVLARLVATTIDLWVDATGEFLLRLASDWAEIQKIFQPETELEQVADVQTDLSDRHHGGRSVMIVTFASGLKLVYKPKNLGIEQAYVKLLAWLNEHNVPLPFKLFQVLNRSGYGWVEFIESFPCKEEEESKLYYQRAGMLLCLVYLLDSTDLHHENIIASGEHPVLIDLETLMHPWVQEVEKHEENNKGVKFLANQQIWYSVLRTALLPQWQFGYNGQPYDVSGLGGVRIKKLSNQQHEEGNIKTNITEYQEVSLSKNNLKSKIQNSKSNLPVPDEHKLALEDYYQKIIDGFQQMYRFLMEHQQALLSPESPLTSFSGQPVRFVFRNTLTYTSVLQHTLNPKFLKDGVDRSIQLDILSRAMLFSDTKPSCWPLLQVEKQALEQMDIPLFTARSDSADLTIAPDITIENYFTEPSFNRVITRLSQLNEQDLEQQIFFIKGSLYSRTTDEAHRISLSDDFSSIFNDVLPLTQEEMVHQAIMIATGIDEQAIRSADSSATWLAPQYILEAQRFQLQPMGHNLFDGSFGVASFLAALTQVMPKTGFRDLSLGALQSFRQDLRTAISTDFLKGIGIGGAVGGGAIVYVLTRISQFLEEQTLLEDAKQVASLINSDIVAADKHFDIISGTAGAILGLLALHTISPDSEVLEKAITCGNHLLNNRVVSDSGYRTWETVDGKLLTGFSHGAAGIAYALLHLYKASGETAFLEAAEEAIAYERSVFIPEEGNWPDFRQSFPKEKPVCMCSWCHGAPGIGLARLGGLDILDTPEIRQDIEAAILTAKQQKLTGIDHLCCGNMGRVEFLLTASRKLSRPDFLEDAMQIASQVVARANQKGHFGYGPILTFHPGFFQGASGIGYELLRLAYPDQLPSVLLWE